MTIQLPDHGKAKAPADVKRYTWEGDYSAITSVVKAKEQHCLACRKLGVTTTESPARIALRKNMVLQTLVFLETMSAADWRGSAKRASTFWSNTQCLRSNRSEGLHPEPLRFFKLSSRRWVLRLIVEHRSQTVKGFWRDDTFFLAVNLSKDKLGAVFSASTLVAPWNGKAAQILSQG